MKLYFSGVASLTELAWLKQAGVTDLLADQFDYAHCATFPHHMALDSGAYRLWKQGGAIDIPTYLQMLDTDRPLDFAIAPDVVGDDRLSYANWKASKQWLELNLPHVTTELVPVWHWSNDPTALYWLQQYLDETEGLIAIGKLVPFMRDKDEDMLRGLTALCEAYGQRLHLLGCNWLKAMEQLRGLAKSGDTSKFLDGGRYGHLIFRNSRTGHLSAAHAKKHLKLETTREERCIKSAIALNAYMNGDELQANLEALYAA